MGGPYLPYIYHHISSCLTALDIRYTHREVVSCRRGVLELSILKKKERKTPLVPTYLLSDCEIRKERKRKRRRKKNIAGRQESNLRLSLTSKARC